MYIKHLLLCIILAVVFCNLCASEIKEKRRLQIGIKHRPKGCSDRSKKGDLLHVNYRVTYENGTEFENSHWRQLPFTFTVGSGQGIKGWDQGLLGMCIGEHRKLVVPSDLGYGQHGVPPIIPGDSILIYYVELLNIERKTFLF